ncbi:GIY-YIG nuclease family protein [uncultured Pseudoteredinibacter sp.]|uniref:GIY-YIG nuclease family protein n=1 Tax=uncultured Pseudoteredinibacter sp. TaxID=1641701 RepID=UPI0026339DC8|nr:GIY-YIG nuclease family protein [uncultured Pseudoteredinibacter sp.]
MMTNDDPWWVYIIECHDGSLYTGITNHLLRRWQQHNSGKGAKFFRSRSPLQLAWIEYPHDKRSAAKREYAIKQLSRRDKLKLIAQ